MTSWDEQRAPRPKDEPRLELRTIYWRVRTPLGRVLTCELYLTDTGLELRAGYSLDDALRTEHCQDKDQARQLAGRWLDALRDTGNFIETDRRRA